MRLALLNGPNLNLLGVREPSVYGTTTLAEVEQQLTAVAAGLGATLVTAQRNGEGELVECVHGWRGAIDGLVVNAGAYSHTSLALRDALVGCALPFVEVHVSNVYAREPERRHSMLAPAAIGVVVGFGIDSYEWGLRALIAWLARRG